MSKEAWTDVNTSKRNDRTFSGMATTHDASRPRCTALWAAVTLAAAGLVGWLLPTLGEPDLVSLDRALVWVCATLAALAAGWLWLITTVVAVAALTGRADAVRGVPAPIRRLLLAACGVALAAGLAGPAGATPGSLASSPGSRCRTGPPQRSPVARC